MKKWTVLILIILAIFCLAAIAYADSDPEPESFSLELRSEQEQREPNFLLWKPEPFEIHTNIIRNKSALFYYDENTEPMWVWINDDGYGEAWFTAGTTDVYPYRFDETYNEDNLIQHYTAHVEYVDDDGNVIATSNEVEYTAGMTSAEAPVFAPVVTNVTNGAIRQDDVFSVTVSNEAGFQTMCVALFNDQGECVVDSHWIDVVDNAEPTVIETPLLRLEVNREYTAKIYGLMHGRPMVFAEETFNILAMSPDSQPEGTDILIRGLHDEYQTGELIMPVVYYPNSEGMQDIQMEITVFASRYENNPDRWDSDLLFWQNDDGGIYYQPEVWDNPIYSWNDGEHVFRVTVWQNNNDQRIPLDGYECSFNVTSKGPIDYDPELPAFIDADSLPYTFTVPRPDAENYRVFGDVFDRLDGDHHEGIWYDDAGDEPMQITVTSASQCVYVCIQVEKHGYDVYEREATIPIVSSNSRISLWTNGDPTEPLPLHTDFPLWVSAPGADWIEAENIDGHFFHEENRERIDDEEPIAFGDNIRRAGDNYVIATAQFTDNEGNSTVESAIVVLQGYAEGEAEAFTATIDRDNVRRGETVTVDYTKSENADHYWVDAEVWNGDGERWEYFIHLADLYVWGENDGGSAILNTMELEPGKYRLRALADSEGYYTADTVITEDFTVRETDIPNSGILVTATAGEVETSEDFQLSAYAPGAEWMEVYWNYGNDNRNNDRDDADSRTWEHSYSRSGTYQIAVRAGRDARDNEGNFIWEHDNDGHTWKKQDEWWSDPVEVFVSADNGPLTLEIPEGIPAVLTPCEENEREISFSVSKPDNADILVASVWIDGVNESLYFNYTWEDGLDVRISPALEAGQVLGISFYADARGYECVETDLRIPVLDDTSSNPVELTIGEGDYPQEEGIYLVPMGGDIKFLVGAAQGHELDAAKLYTPDGWWGGGEEIRHDNHEDWFENGRAFFHTHFGNENNIGITVPVFAMARIDGSDEWIQSDLIRVRQTDYEIGTYHFTSEAEITVARGEDAVFTFSSAAGADHYWVDAWDVYSDNDSYNPNCGCSGTTVTMNTAQLPEGEFIIRGRAGADGKGWRESDDSVRLIVTASNVPEGEIRLSVDRTEALTQERISASVYAPGADWVEIIRRHVEGNWTDRFADSGGEGTTGSFAEGNEKTVEVYARAHYFELDENGNTIPEQDEHGHEYLRELPYVESETVVVTVTAPYGPIELDGNGVPVSAMAGADLPLCVPVPENAENMDWELYLNRDHDDDEQRPDYSGKGALNITVPGNRIISGNNISLRVWAGATGYEGAEINLDIRVIEAHESRITLSVSKNEVEVSEEFAVTVTAPGVESIQYYNGNCYWSEWDNDLQTEVNQDLELDQNGQWIHNDQNYDDAGVKALYARAWIDGEWVYSDPVKVIVTKTGKVGCFSIEPDQATVNRGDPVTLSYTEAEHSDESRYDLRHDRDRSNDGDNDVHYDLHWWLNEEDNELTILTAGMPAGEYWLRVRAQGETGYESRESSQVMLRVNEPAGNKLKFTILESTVQTGEDLHVSLYAPGACRSEIHWHEDDTWDFDGESWCGNYSYGIAGTYRVYALVWYPDQEDPVKTDEIPISVTSNGEVIPLDLSSLPAALTAGADAQITVSRPAGSGYMNWEIFINDDREPYAHNHDGKHESLNQTIPGTELHEGDTVRVIVWTGAFGYDNNHQEVRIPVTAAPGEGITLTVSESTVLVNHDFTVTVNAPGASRIQYFDGFGFWMHWDHSIQQDVITDLVPDDDGNWTHEHESFGCAGSYTLYARAWIPDAENENGGSWITSAPAAITVTRNHWTGDQIISLAQATVTRGDTVRLNYTVAEYSDEGRYDLHHDRDRRSDGDNEVRYDLEWQRDEDADQITFSTARMPAGRYWLSIWAPGNAEGYEGQESGRIWLTVTEPAGEAVEFEVARSTVLTNENIQAGVYAPGACRGEIHWHEGDKWDFEGESWTGRYSYNNAGVYQVFARVWYPDDENPVDSEMITITVNSDGEKTPFDLSGVPGRIIAGTDTTITVPRPEDALYMGWEIWINDSDEPYAHNHDGEQESLNQEIPGTDLQEGDMILLKVWAGAIGYDHNHQEIRIPVVSQTLNGIAFTVNSGSVATCADVDCTAIFPEGVFSKIQFFDGERYWPEENIDGEATGWEGTTSFGINGTYTLFARLKRTSDGKWIYTPGTEVTITAPNGPLTLDVSGVPARIYEGNDVTFTLGAVKDSSGNPVDGMPDYELYYNDGTGHATDLIRWDDEPKTGTITISSEDIAEGRVYTLNYNVFAGGYEPAMGSVEFRAYAEPTVTLSVDKKNVCYGDEVNFTVNAPGATSTSIVKWENGAPGRDMYWGGTTWRTGWWAEDQVGTYQFGAKAVYEGFGTVYTSRPVTVNVLSLGEAPAPDYMDIPDGGTEGAGYHIRVTPAPGGWVSMWIYYGDDDDALNYIEYSMDRSTELEINDVLAGTYRVVIQYGMDGYDDGQIERDFEVGYWFNCRRPVRWEWEDDFSAATAVFSSLRQVSYDPVQYETYLRIDAEVSSEVTKEPTCGEPGTRVYTATEKYSGYNYTDTRTETLVVVEHDWDEPVFTWTETEDGYSATATFTCRNDDTHTRTENADVAVISHSNATCTAPEETVYRAICEDFSEDKTVEGEPAYGHDWEWRIVWNDDYTAYATRKCDHCGETENAEVEVVQTVTGEATCQVRGEITWSAEVTLEGEHLESSRKQYTQRLPHTPGEPTFSEDHHFIYTHCSVCGELLSMEYYEHQWSDPVIVWADDFSSVTATRICELTPELPHIETETVSETEHVFIAPTDTTAGENTYTAVFRNTAFGTQIKQTIIKALNEMSVLRLPSALREIEREAFANLACEAVIIPNGCTTIGEYAFSGCKDLVYVRIPASVTEWPENAFNGCNEALVIDHITAD